MKEIMKIMDQVMEKKEKTCLKSIMLKFFDVIPMILILIFFNFYAKQISTYQNYAKKMHRIRQLIKLLKTLKNSCSDKIKRIKTICQKNFTKIQKMKNTKSEIKPIKIGKRPGTTYCFGCKDYTKSFRPQEINMTNKVHREKSICVVCRSKKSRFLK